MANHPNRKQRPALAPEFPRVIAPSGASEAEQDAADALTAASEAAILPWRWHALDARATVHDVEQGVADAALRVSHARRQLAEAEAALAHAEADASVRLPQLRNRAADATRHYELARSAVIDARGPRSRWRVSRSGRIVSVSDGLDLQRVEWAVVVDLEYGPNPAHAGLNRL